MAAELPYFRFTVSEWMNGDISMEDYGCKGLFIDVCSWYWFKDCSVTRAMLEKKFTEPHTLQLLYDSEVIKLDGENVIIEFLNDQFDILSEKRKVRQAAGSKGGKQKSSNAKAMLKQKPSYKDNNNNKDKDKSEKKFNQPTQDEVKNYCRERNKGVNPVKWFNHYTSNGWKVGKNPMKNWKAAVHTWEDSDIGAPGSLPASKGSNLGGSKLPADYGKASSTSMTREEYLKQKKNKP